MEPSIIHDYDPRKLPQEALAAIGLSVACAAQTEHVLEIAIGGCLGLNSAYATVVTAHMAMPLRFDIVKAAAEIRLESVDDLDELDDLLEKIATAMLKRNEVAHNIWCSDPNTKQLYTLKISARGSLLTNLIPMDIQKIRDDAMVIYTAGMNLMSFLMAKDLVPPFPDGKIERAHKLKAARKKRREELARKK